MSPTGLVLEGGVRLEHDAVSDITANIPRCNVFALINGNDGIAYTQYNTNGPLISLVFGSHGARCRSHRRSVENWHKDLMNGVGLEK